MLPLTLVLASMTVGESPRFTVHTTELKPTTGQILRLDADGTLTLKDPAALVPAGNLVSLRRLDRPLPAFARNPMIILANGDRIRGVVLGGDTKVIKFQPAWSKDAPWEVSLSTLAAIWGRPQPADMPTDPSAYPWADSPKRRDVLWLRNGDIARGTIEGFTVDPLGVRIKTADPLPTTHRLDNVTALAFDPSLARVRKPKTAYYRLTLTDGSRIGLATAISEGTSLSGTTLFGPKLQVPLTEVVSLDVHQGKAIYLSDLKPKKAEVQPYQSMSWPWAADRSIRGNPITLGADTFEKGLGTHSRTTLTYDLAGKYRRFESLVGLDPLTGRRGAVDLRILIDGKEQPLPDLLGLTLGKSPQAITIDLKAAKELTLIVDYGPTGDVQDDVNWADARLIE